jgi:hypothetical protein
MRLKQDSIIFNACREAMTITRSQSGREFTGFFSYEMSSHSIDKFFSIASFRRREYRLEQEDRRCERYWDREQRFSGREQQRPHTSTPLKGTQSNADSGTDSLREMDTRSMEVSDIQAVGR